MPLLSLTAVLHHMYMRGQRKARQGSCCHLLTVGLGPARLLSVHPVKQAVDVPRHYPSLEEDCAGVLLHAWLASEPACASQ